MTDPYSKSTATSAEEATKIFPRVEFRVFGRGVIEIVKPRMWAAHAVLQGRAQASA